MENIESNLKEFIAENILFSTDGFIHGDDTSFLETGIIDSMSVMDLVLFVESTYKIPISDKEITPENFDSINNLAQFIRSKQGVSE